ncbi:MAG: hypothetical protein FWF65_01725 [Bacteroidetes bacterium]|nr:hypothetical protein [Bacteroidota bacterium]
MNENEKNLFYKVLKDNITEVPSPELANKIMHIVHTKAHKRLVAQKIWTILGYALLIIGAMVFVGGYLFFYTDFKLPVLQIHFEMPSRMGVTIISIIFVFLLIELYFRKRLYERS